ncbi:glycosyltransferase [Roseomonas chloroacetimidivorans]|uniref:glycosyltransferase n=1 Tax=Roseomonas chloroacetimidivorans TaxID=1766656 RepID=UPI003C793D35
MLGMVDGDASRLRTGEDRFAAYLDEIVSVLGHAGRVEPARAYCDAASAESYLDLRGALRAVKHYVSLPLFLVLLTPAPNIMRPASDERVMTASPATQPVCKIETGLNKLRKWYFCANERGLKREFRSVRAAVASALRCTTLVPCCIYDGQNCVELERLQKAGVRVLRHSSVLSTELRAAYSEKYDVFCGHWLRLDLPMLETEADQVLYTDIDVVFLRDPRSYAFTPRSVAVCEETRLGDRRHFNSGVMVMNLPALRESRPALLKAVRQRLSRNFLYPPHDQKSLNDALLGEAEWMMPEMNWKPYWGPNPDAVIGHFHGPKPWHIMKIRAGLAQEMKPSFRTLHDRSPEGYDALIAAFEAASGAAGELGL